MQVVAATPLPGLGVPLRDVPANVQIFGADDITRTRNQSLTRFLGDNAASGIAPVSEQFVAVGAPRTISVGLRYPFDAPGPGD